MHFSITAHTSKKWNSNFIFVKLTFSFTSTNWRSHWRTYLIKWEKFLKNSKVSWGESFFYHKSNSHIINRNARFCCSTGRSRTITSYILRFSSDRYQWFIFMQMLRGNVKMEFNICTLYTACACIAPSCHMFKYRSHYDAMIVYWLQVSFLFYTPTYLTAYKMSTTNDFGNSVVRYSFGQNKMHPCMNGKF